MSPDAQLHLTPTIDAIIPVHSPSRLIERAVSSIIDNVNGGTRVTVVAHNTPRAPIMKRLGRLGHDPAVRVLELLDDVPSPSGPFNLGLDHATAPWVTFVGSDDELEPGSLQNWLGIARATAADVVVAPIRLSNGAMDPYPPVRWRRRTGLDGRRDRLAYRSAPLGLVSRRRFADVRFPRGIVSGEDIPYSLQLFFTGASVAYDPRGPAYVVHGDARDRVSFTPRDVSVDFAFVPLVVESDWFRACTQKEKESIVAKLIRTHFVDALSLRSQVPGFGEVSLPALGNVLDRLLAAAPGAWGIVSRADSRLLEAVARKDADAVRKLLPERWSYWHPRALLSAALHRSLSSNAPMRTLSAGLLTQAHASRRRAPQA